jgi:hypothetical protein
MQQYDMLFIQTLNKFHIMTKLQKVFNVEIQLLLITTHEQ